jgi:hypothetical protein
MMELYAHNQPVSSDVPEMDRRCRPAPCSPLRYVLYRDGHGWAVYDPHEVRISYTSHYLAASEALLESWANVVGLELADHHKIPTSADIERLIAANVKAD